MRYILNSLCLILIFSYISRLNLPLLFLVYLAYSRLTLHCLYFPRKSRIFSFNHACTISRIYLAFSRLTLPSLFLVYLSGYSFIFSGMYCLFSPNPCNYFFSHISPILALTLLFLVYLAYSRLTLPILSS
jgi:hypothetical protein